MSSRESSEARGSERTSERVGCNGQTKPMLCMMRYHAASNRTNTRLVHQARSRWADVLRSVARSQPRPLPFMTAEQSRHEALARTAVQVRGFAAAGVSQTQLLWNQNRSRQNLTSAVQAARMLLQRQRTAEQLQRALLDAHDDLARQTAVVAAVTASAAPSLAAAAPGSLPPGVKPSGHPSEPPSAISFLGRFLGLGEATESPSDAEIASSPPAPTAAAAASPVSVACCTTVSELSLS